MNQRFFDQKYTVSFSDFCVKKHKKYFLRKYKKLWDKTEESIINSLERLVNLEKTDVLDVICDTNTKKIFAKYSFKIAKTNSSAKTSGNRCILEVCNNKRCVRILFIYNKDKHIPSKEKNETEWWKKVISDEFDIHCLKYFET